MARKKQAIPSYLLHKSSGQARVRCDGKDILLGQYGSEVSRVRYGEIIAKIASGQQVDPMAKPKRGTTPKVEADQGPSVNEIVLAFWKHAEQHYRKNGKETSEMPCFRSCLRVLKHLYGMTPAKNFGPLALKAVRASMVAGDPHAKDHEGKPAPRKPWARRNINIMIGRIRRVFKYAVECEMIDVGVLNALQTVQPLLAGRTAAVDHPKRHALAQDKIDVVKAKVRPVVRDLIDLQILTGARSGELLGLTTGMIDRTGQTWKAVITDHKTAHHHGRVRMIPFGPKAQLILAKYLQADQGKRLFKMKRPAYGQAITRACDKAEITRWSPHWLRHTFATRTREQLGIEAVQSIVGHATTEMTNHYSSQMEGLAMKTAQQVG